MQDAIYASLSSNLGMHWAGEGDKAFTRTGNRHGGLAECPYNVYPTRDGYIALICVGDLHWAALCRVLERTDLIDNPKYRTLKDRVAHMDEVDDIIAEWARGDTTAAVFDKLMAVKIPCAPVRTLEEVMNDPNMHARGALARIEHPEFGNIVVQRSPLRYEGATEVPLEPSHALGADTEAVLRERTSLDDAAIAAMIGKTRG